MVRSEKERGRWLLYLQIFSLSGEGQELLSEYADKSYSHMQTHSLEDSALFYSCQFIIAAHSPFLPALKAACIYNLDQTPVSACRWTEVENVRAF